MSICYREHEKKGRMEVYGLFICLYVIGNMRRKEEHSLYIGLCREHEKKRKTDCMSDYVGNMRRKEEYSLYVGLCR